MKKLLNIILFGRKKSYVIECTLTLIGLYIGVLFWYLNVTYLGQPIQNALVLAVFSLIYISIILAMYRIPEQLCVNPQIEMLLYFPVDSIDIIYTVIIKLFKTQFLLFVCCFLSSLYYFNWNVLLLILTAILCAFVLIVIDLCILSISVVISTISKKYCGYILLAFQYGGFLFVIFGIVRLIMFVFEKQIIINAIYCFIDHNYLFIVSILIVVALLSYTYTKKICDSNFTRSYHYLSCFTKPSYHTNISKYLYNIPYVMNEWCRVSRNKELLFYSNLKTLITVYLLVNIFADKMLVISVVNESIIKVIVLVLCCAMNTISTTSYTSDKNYSYYKLFPIKNSSLFFSKVFISSLLNEIVIICAWFVCSISKTGLFFDMSLFIYGTFTNILCSLIGVYFDYKMPKIESSTNEILHGNMSKIYVLIIIMSFTIFEIYLWQKFALDKLYVGLLMMNLGILLSISGVMYMKRGILYDRN